MNLFSFVPARFLHSSPAGRGPDEFRRGNASRMLEPGQLSAGIELPRRGRRLNRGTLNCARPAAGWKMLAAGIFVLLVLSLPCALYAANNADCLACHADKTLQNAAGKSVAVDGDTFHASVHSGLSCTDCHSSVKGFPHPDHPAAVQCTTCHADQTKGLEGSVHAAASPGGCLSCHGSPHAIFPKDDARSAVYPLNIPRTCGTCHGSERLAKKYGLQNVYSVYMDSIHGYAVSKEGLLVAANCMSCHGSHHILSHKNPKSPTYKANIPATCGTCHGGVNDEYLGGVHGKAVASGNMKAPVCTDCHTAHAILQPTLATFRMQSTPICGSCHQGRFATYGDTFHSQLGLLGGYVQTARCWDCHGAHEILPASDPRSPVAPGNLIKTCGKCHADANASFVQYQPHANPRNRRLNPALYYIRLFMNLLLWSVLGFFALHTLLWFIRSKREQDRNGHAGR
ncbi:MAG TPA: cytochrome c3 family protein [Acidobacteriaceae bacterium]|nr:cytochrome c3 family protein [Terriglobia bacterium]HVC89034.1 cytochrome c3 family protein [Acidobacteriaceae bacterium]